MKIADQGRQESELGWPILGLRKSSNPPLHLETREARREPEAAIEKAATVVAGVNSIQKKSQGLICCKKKPPNYMTWSTSGTELKTLFNSFTRIAKIWKSYQSFYVNHSNPGQNHHSFKAPNDAEQSNCMPWKGKWLLQSWTQFCSGLHKNAAKYPLAKVEVAAFMVILQLWVLYELLGKEFLIIRNNPNNKTV